MTLVLGGKTFFGVSGRTRTDAWGRKAEEIKVRAGRETGDPRRRGLEHIIVDILVLSRLALFWNRIRRSPGRGQAREFGWDEV
jgi:hypothetical protein